jgi:PilZ domain
MGWCVALPDSWKTDQLREILTGEAETGILSRGRRRPDTFKSLRSLDFAGRHRGPMDLVSKRTEDRTPMKVIVDLSSLDVRMPAQEGVTENVSPRGARVLTSRPWKPNDRLNVRSLLGNFRSRARVVYCVPVDNHQFAVGLQLFAAAGKWRSPN